jgi:hypothetical protein
MNCEPPHPAALAPDALLSQCSESRDRASGPGGQHRNKVETRVTLLHTETGIVGSAGERRSQEQNRKKALFRLRLNLAVQVRRAAGPVSALWRGRCRAGRIRCNAEHADFPALLAESLDRLAAGDWQPKAAALALSCSASQLIKLVKQHRPAFEYLNRQRRDAGLHPLK